MQLTQLTHGLTRGHLANSLVIQNQNTFEPLLRSPENGTGCYEAEHMLPKRQLTHGNDAREENKKEDQDQAKVRL